MESNSNELVINETLKENMSMSPVSNFFVVVSQPDTADRKYCLVPPFGRNPFSADSLEKTNVRLYSSLVDLSRAIRDLPPSVKVDAGDPRLCQPS